MPFFLSGCSSLYFFYQAGKGQLSLLNRGKPIEEVIQDPTTDPKLATLLSKVGEVKKFGEQYGLKPTSNYREYVKLDRDAVVYVVTVSDELAFRVKIFSFPIAGSFNYIGWFSRDDAIKFAKEYQEKGFDVDVRGASAYSTLGWFDDPLLSSMIPKHNGGIALSAYPDLVNVVIHESVHATVYVKGQSYFNESLASFVAGVLTEKYFQQQKMIGSSEWKEYLDDEKLSKQMRIRMMRAYQDLNQIYASELGNVQKREKKAEYISKLQDELKFKRPITNATIVQFKTYDDSDHGFEALLAREGGDIARFMKVLARLKSSDFAREHQEDFDVMKVLKNHNK